jgi:hypothetical protein
VKMYEHEGALYRGLHQTHPTEIFNFRSGKWEAYHGEVPKKQNWGSEISTKEAEAWIKKERPA